MKYRTLRAPFNVQVEITWGCDNKCRHCYNFFRHDNELKVSMGLKEIDKVALELVKNQVIRVIPTGGEPLLEPEITLRLIKKLKKHNIGVMLNSNMNNFTRAIGNELLKRGTDTIMTSLIADNAEIHDWVTQHSGSFKKASKGIELAGKMGFRVIVNMVLTKWNIDRVRQTGNLVGRWQVAKFGATRACAPGPIANDFKKNLISIDELRRSLKVLYELKKTWKYEVDVLEHYPWCAMQDIEKYKYLARRKCTAGITSCSIGANGQMRPCGHSAMTYGNVFKEGLEKPWLKMEDWRQQVYSLSCKSCEHFEPCTGGCPVEAMNSKSGKDHHCTGPQDVIRLPKKSTVLPEVEGKLFYIPPEIILRKETFGGVIGSGKGGVTMVGKDTFQMLLGLRGMNAFDVNTLVNRFGAQKKEASVFLARLLRQKLLCEEVTV